MLIARVVIVPAQNPDGICDIGRRGSYRVHKASDHQSVYGQIAGLFVGRLLLKLRCHWRGNWPGLVHSELRQDRPNVAVWMDVDRVMLRCAFDVHTEIEGDTPEIIHPDPLLHLVLDLPNEALVSTDEEIIDVQNNCGNGYALIRIMEQRQSSADT